MSAEGASVLTIFQATSWIPHCPHKLFTLFYNFLLQSEKEVAIAKLLERGTWGESGTDLLSEKDTPVIHHLYDQMEAQLEHQQDNIVIAQRGNSVQQTYQTVLSCLQTE
jgi:hypothetical protein